ncbi:pectinesterase [Ranunculus cassubicifolius]
MMGKVAVAGISLILVVGVIIGVVATVSRSGGSTTSQTDSKSGISTGMKAVETLCAPADYRDVCMKTLAPVAQKNSNATPKDLVEATFEATLQTVMEAFNQAGTIKFDDKDLLEKNNMEACKELMQYAEHELRSALRKLSDVEMHTLGELGADLKNWLSAVMAYSSDCVEFIQAPQLKKDMENLLVNTTQLTYNTLAIVDEVSKILNKINMTIPSSFTNSRRLLNVELDNDEYPTWVSASDRKLLAARNNNLRPNAVVAKDGSGQFNSIQAAVNAYPKNHQGRYIIYVKAGIYNEIVEIPNKAVNVFIYGDGPRKTIVTVGDGFIAKSMAFRNTAGPMGEQAVALRVNSEGAVIYNCRIDGYQDTLYYHAKRQFYRNCVISGTVDFIFGHGTAVIQNSQIILRLGKLSSQNTITADGRQDARVNSGVVLQNCRILPEKRLVPRLPGFASYFGRPWKAYARTMVMESEIPAAIRPEGWLPFNGNSFDKTCEYREYANRGPGALANRRVNWSKVITDRRAAEAYTVGGMLREVIPAIRGGAVPVLLGLTR